jgi:hypothetical protein
MAVAGYVKVWRDMLDHEVMQDDWLCRLWMWCLFKASFQPTDRSKWYRGIMRLVALGCIAVETSKVNNHWTRITVCNYTTYQDAKTKPRTARDSLTDPRADAGADSLLVREEGEERKKAHRVFVPPSVEEVKAYCLERKNNVNPEQFVDHYQANGWVQGRQGKPIKDWQACVRTWEKMEFRQNKQPAGKIETPEERHQRIVADQLRRREETERLKAETATIDVSRLKERLAAKFSNGAHS